MPYTPISDFRGGLDTRKMSLTLPAGTLVQCQNAHINQGAEIEKRKAFVPTAIGVTDSFGIQPVPNGIMIFGSTNHSATSFPAPLIYQQLQHPQTLAGGATINMSAVLHSCLFGDFAFVIAQFADGSIFCYYNGILIPDFTSGVVLSYLAGNDTALAANIAGLVNTTNNYSARSSGGVLEVLSAPGNSYQASVITTGISNISVATQGNLNYSTATVSNTTGNNCGDGTTVTVGGRSYRFKLVMAAAYDIQIGATATATLNNLYLAINASGTAGTNYYAGTVANAAVVASLFVSTPNPSFTVTAKTINSAGVTENAIPGVSLIESGLTIPSATGAQAQGQFRVVAGVPSTLASAYMSVPVSGGSQPNDGSTFIITNGASVQTYRFKNTMSAAYDVQIASNYYLTFVNLIYAINANGTAGTNYFAGTLASPNVTTTNSVVSGSYNVSTITSIAPGAAGNSITLTHSGTTNIAVSGSPLSGGQSGVVSVVNVGPVAAFINLDTNSTLIYGWLLSYGLLVGGLKYNLVNALANEGDVLIGVSKADTLTNLLEAINLSGIYGVNYQVTNLNQQVYCLPTLVNGKITFVARTPGAIGNSISLQLTSSGGGTMLSGGSDSISLLSAPVTWFAGATLNSFTNQLVNAINQNTPTSGFYAKNLNQTVYLYTSGYDSYANNAVVSVTSMGVAIGYCGFSFALNSNAGASPGSASVTQIQINGFNVMSAAVLLSTYGTIAGLVAAVAANINANTAAGPSGGAPNINAIWQAIAIGNVLYLANISTTSNDPPQTVSIATDTTGYLSVGIVGNYGLSCSVTPRNINFVRIDAVTATTSPVVATCLATGGYPPYTYYWQWLSGDTAFSVSDPTKQNVTFYRQDSAGSNTTEWVCVVTDSNGNTATSNPITVYQP